MDGTFLDEKGRLPEGAFELIDALAEKKIVFAVATGRQTKTIENDFAPVVDQIAIIAENGSVVKYKSQTLSVTTLDVEKVRSLLQELRGIEGAITVLCTEHKAYIEAPKELIEEEIKKYYHSREYVGDLLEVEEAPIKVAVYHPKQIKGIHDLMQPKWYNDFKLAVSGEHWVDFGHICVNKGRAIVDLQEKLGIEKAESMAFGDYFNDLELLDEVGESYVMEKAPEAVKRHAKYEIQAGAVIETIYKVVTDL